MTPKEYLTRAIRIERQIDADLQEACRLRALAEKTAVAYPATRSGGSSRNRMEDAVVKLVDLEAEISESIHRMVRVKEEIRDAIQSLPKQEERMVLQLRYLCGKKWEQIAVDMNYGWAQIHRIHANALIKIGKMIHNDT